MRNICCFGLAGVKTLVHHVKELVRHSLDLDCTREILGARHWLYRYCAENIGAQGIEVDWWSKEILVGRCDGWSAPGGGSGQIDYGNCLDEQPSTLCQPQTGIVFNNHLFSDGSKVLLSR